MNQELLNQDEPLILPVPRRKRWRWVFLCLCSFVCGVLIGPVIAWAIMGHLGPGRGPGTDDLEERVDRVVEHMRNDLDLTDEQTKQVYTITKKQFIALDEALRKNFDAMNSEIRALLNDKQIIKYEEWMNKRFERFPGPPHRPDMPMGPPGGK
jgi:hypothetical protein